MAEYQGHHCRNCWNVALWIGNDEGLYRLAMECLTCPRKKCGQPVSIALATTRFLAALGDQQRTPDGARYTRQAVHNALSGLRD